MTPVIFLHGIGGGGRAFAPQIASFAAAGYQPIALDLPGYGARTPVEAMNFEALAEDVEATIAHAALEQPVLVGHSMGGMLAQTLLRRRPEGYAAAVLSCTSRPSAIRPAISRRSSWRTASRRSMKITPWRARARTPPTTSMGPNADPAGRTLFIETFAATFRRHLSRGGQLSGHFDERGNLPHIKVPVLCLAAEHDRNAPAPWSRRWRQRSPARNIFACPASATCRTWRHRTAFDAAIFNFLEHALAAKR